MQILAGMRFGCNISSTVNWPVEVAAFLFAYDRSVIVLFYKQHDWPATPIVSLKRCFATRQRPMSTVLGSVWWTTTRMTSWVYWDCPRWSPWGSPHPISVGAPSFPSSLGFLPPESKWGFPLFPLVSQHGVVRLSSRSLAETDTMCVCVCRGMTVCLKVSACSLQTKAITKQIIVTMQRPYRV